MLHKFCCECGRKYREGEERESPFCIPCEASFDEEDDLYDEEYYKEKREEELAERAESCICGAWQFAKNGTVIHVADCYCGAE